MTELHDHLKLLFAKIGVPHCPKCGEPVARETPERVAFDLVRRPDGNPRAGHLRPGRPRVPALGRGSRRISAAAGFRRVLVGEEVREVEDVANAAASRCASSPIAWWCGRDQEKRATDSIEQAFRFGKGSMALVFPDTIRGRRATARISTCAAL